MSCNVKCWGEKCNRGKEWGMLGSASGIKPWGIPRLRDKIRKRLGGKEEWIEGKLHIGLVVCVESKWVTCFREEVGILLLDVADRSS